MLPYDRTLHILSKDQYLIFKNIILYMLIHYIFYNYIHKKLQRQYREVPCILHPVSPNDYISYKIILYIKARN